MKIKKSMILLLLFLVFAGCAQAGEENETPAPSGTQYTEGDLFENVAPDESTEPEKTDLISGENLSGSQEVTDNPGYLEVQENIDYVKYDAANCYRSTDPEKDRQSLFCIDPDTGVVYFVNQEQDWYIYRLYDERVEVAVELPARELHMLDGRLYFIIEGYDKYQFDEIREGDIYVYTPKDDSINKVFSAEDLENPIQHIIPYEDGIALYYFSYRRVDKDGTEVIVETKEEATKWRYIWCYYGFKDEILEEDLHKRSMLCWGDYYIMPTIVDGVWKTVLWSRTDGTKDTLDFNIGSTRSFVVEDTLYACGDKFYITNLARGEQQIFDVKAMVEKLLPERYGMVEGHGSEVKMTFGFTTTNEHLWVVIFQQYLLRIDPESGEAACFKLRKGSVSNLYTDGIHLYALYNTEVSGDGRSNVVRICTEETEGRDTVDDVPLLDVEYLIEK